MGSPSLRHQLAAAVVSRRSGRSRSAPTPAQRLERALAAQTRRAAAGPAGLPTHLVRGFDRDFTLGHDDAAGFRTWTLTPRHTTPTRTIVHLHGGSYVKGFDPLHVVHACLLARRLGARVVLPDYPYAPAATWRDSHDALVALVSDACTRAADADELPAVLSGDSAGGGLALAVAMGLRDAGGAQPGRLVLHAPWVDLTLSSPGTAEAAARDPWLDADLTPVYAGWWAGADDQRRWELSPLFGDLTGLPPALMLHGTRDLLSAGCRDLAGRAQEAGWALHSIEEEGLLHVYSLFPQAVPEARRALSQIVEFIDSPEGALSCA